MHEREPCITLMLSIEWRFEDLLACMAVGEE